MANILMGAPVAEALTEKMKADVDALKAKGVVPVLAILRASERPDDISRERGAVECAKKVGVAVKKVILPADICQEDFDKVLISLNEDPEVHGILMLRPLSEQPYSEKTTDGSQTRVFTNTETDFPPCASQAVMEILDHYGVEIKGLDAVTACVLVSHVIEAAKKSDIKPIEKTEQNTDKGNYRDLVFLPEDYKGIEIRAEGDREAITDRLIDRIAENKGITYPESLIEGETKDLVTGYMQHLKYAAMGSGSMPGMKDVDMEQVEAEIRTQVIHELNEDTIIKGIIKNESIDVSREELEKEAHRISEEQGTSIEMVKRFFGDDFSGLTNDIRKQKARRLIYDSAKLIS